MSDYVDSSFIDDVHSASNANGGNESLISTKARDFIVPRARLLLDSKVKYKDKRKAPDICRAIVCVKVAKALIKGTINEEMFWNYVKYEHLFIDETDYSEANTEWGPFVVLRYPAENNSTPPVMVFSDGSWGWINIIGRNKSQFDEDILQAGMRKKDPSPFIAEIDKLKKREKSWF